MTRPPLEVADLVRAAGTAFIERNRQWLRWTHIKILLAIARCRTAAVRVYGPSWSPDGSRIAFMDVRYYHPWRISRLCVTPRRFVRFVASIELLALPFFLTCM